MEDDAHLVTQETSEPGLSVSRGSKRAAVVVLGNLGRSPRLTYPGHSLAEHRSYNVAMDRGEMARWIASRRAAEERERRELGARAPAPREAVRGALELLALWTRLHGWPPAEDPVSRREDARAIDQWRRLRMGLARH